MVRASTRSKTTASLSAARAKAVSASTKTKTVTNVDDAVIQSPGRGKPKSKSKPTPPKPNSLKATTEHSTQITIDGDEEDKENVNHLVAEDIEGGDVEGGVESDPVKGEVEEDQSRSKPVEVMLKESDAPVWCLCRGVDDGSPMIKCEGCDGWYHFHCISLIDTDAEEIGVLLLTCSQGLLLISIFPQPNISALTANIPLAKLPDVSTTLFMDIFCLCMSVIFSGGLGVHITRVSYVPRFRI